ncbi:2844_t:CDS:2 [Cetraspora pellucida]|uniref:2844_t:CDS:1 n=1 Tax=Cetraspora pellucida TaxID=1433469 RepID=A0A9N8VGI3_9GLOM|nr:2844_t:CDS:2 [Cetraspora pellucida]
MNTKRSDEHTSLKEIMLKQIANDMNNTSQTAKLNRSDWLLILKISLALDDDKCQSPKEYPSGAVYVSVYLNVAIFAFVYF